MYVVSVYIQTFSKGCWCDASHHDIVTIRSPSQSLQDRETDLGLGRTIRLQL